MKQIKKIKGFCFERLNLNCKYIYMLKNKYKHNSRTANFINNINRIHTGKNKEKYSSSTCNGFFFTKFFNLNPIYSHSIF